MPETKIVITKNLEELNRDAAKLIVDASREAITQSGRFILALSGGSTPKKLYELLATPEWNTQVDWTRIHFFWGDERMVLPDHADSNYRMTNEALLSKVAVPPANIHRVKTELNDPAKVAADYEAEIYRVLGGEKNNLPKFDLILLGMGDNAHTASLFPHTDALKPSEHIVLAPYVAEVNSYRITFTAPLINNAHKIAFLLAGAKKAPVVEEVLHGARDPERLPSQLIHPAHGTLYWMMDEPAAAQLSKKTA